MRFAYLILAHKNIGQLRRLIRAISDEHVFVFVHIDRQSRISDFIDELDGLHRVIFCKHQKQVSWGGFGMIEATLELMHTMYDYGLQPDYVHLISGQDFPLRSNTEIVRFFNENRGMNFIETYTIPSSQLFELGLNRIRYYWYIEDEGYFKANQLVEKQKQLNMVRPYFKDIQPYNGSQWWSLTSECVQWIYETCKPGYHLYDFYKYTFVPDEMLFQTMLKNSDWNDTIANNNLRCINWKDGPEFPRTWRIKDFERLMASGKLFARKFDEKIDKEIIDMIEEKRGSVQVRVLA
jgi:hypothetical protein